MEICSWSSWRKVQYHEKEVNENTFPRKGYLGPFESETKERVGRFVFIFTP